MRISLHHCTRRLLSAGWYVAVPSVCDWTWLFSELSSSFVRLSIPSVSLVTIVSCCNESCLPLSSRSALRSIARGSRFCLSCSVCCTCTRVGMVCSFRRCSVAVSCSDCCFSSCSWFFHASSVRADCIMSFCMLLVARLHCCVISVILFIILPHVRFHVLLVVCCWSMVLSLGCTAFFSGFSVCSVPISMPLPLVYRFACTYIIAGFAARALVGNPL